MYDDQQHEVDEEDGTLNDVFLGFRQALGRVPACPFKKEVMNTAIKLPVQLAEILAPVSLGNAMLLSLIINTGGDHASLALSSAQLLQWWLPTDVLRGNQAQQVGRREFLRPVKGLARRQTVGPRAVGGVGGRGRSHNVL